MNTPLPSHLTRSSVNKPSPIIQLSYIVVSDTDLFWFIFYCFNTSSSIMRNDSGLMIPPRRRPSLRHHLTEKKWSNSFRPKFLFVFKTDINTDKKSYRYKSVQFIFVDGKLSPHNVSYHVLYFYCRRVVLNRIGLLKNIT